MLFKKCNEKFGAYKYLIFRLVVGFLFFGHGAQKLLGWFGGKAVGNIFSWPFGIAGIIEVVVGLAIFFGIWGRLAAMFGAIEMFVAFIASHSCRGLISGKMCEAFNINPFANGGELALLYFVAFLALMLYGNGKFSLENAILKKETF